MDNYKIYLKTHKPIDFYNVCTIYQPILDEILDMKMNKFDNMLIPFSITIDDIGIEDNKDVKMFDIFTNSPEWLYMLVQSLEYFCRSEVTLDKMGISFKGYEGFLNRDNFGELCEIMLEVCGRQPRPPKPVFKNEQQREIWEIVQRGRMREAQKPENQVNLEDIMNICQYGGDYYISIGELLKFTLWELMNCYKAKLGNSNYKDSFQVYLQCGDSKIIENNHWTDLIKITKK